MILVLSLQTVLIQIDNNDKIRPKFNIRKERENVNMNVRQEAALTPMFQC